MPNSSPAGVLPDANMPPCHVGLVFALALEAGPLENKLAGKIAVRGSKVTAWQGGLNGRGIVVVHTGAGERNAAAATEMLILGHRPRWVISAGLAGGLQSAVKRGDVVIPDAILGEDGRRLAIDVRMAAEEQGSSSAVQVGPLLTINRVAWRAEEKQQLGQQYGALAVDMETLAVAEMCRREKQRFLAVRVVSDTVEEELPADVERLMTRKTWGRRIGAAAGMFIHRPSTVKDLWRLRERAIVCSQKLAEFLVGVIGQLE